MRYDYREEPVSYPEFEGWLSHKYIGKMEAETYNTSYYNSTGGWNIYNSERDKVGELLHNGTLLFRKIISSLAYWREVDGFKFLNPKDATRYLYLMSVKNDKKIVSEIFTEKGFPLKMTEHGSFQGSNWYRYEFTVGELEYETLFSVKPVESETTGQVMLGRIDFAPKGYMGAFDIMMNPKDTIRVMKTIGEIIEKHKNEIDYLEITSVEKRIKSYKALIGRLSGFEISHQDANNIYLKRLGAPAPKPKAQKTKEEPALVEEFIRKFIRASLVK